MVGLSMSLAGVFGIVGTVLFTRLHRYIGLERTGLIAFISELLCLVLCLASIWSPGSLFDPHYTDLPSVNADSCDNGTAGLNGGNDTMRNMTSSDRRNETMDFVEEKGTNISIILFLVGIISSRIGKNNDCC